MRNAELVEIKDQKTIHQLLDCINHGVLGVITEEGFPYTVPVNFVRMDEKIYFHGAQKGMKMECIVANPKVSFTVVKELAYVPSYFSGSELACPATQFFESVIMTGHASVVSDLNEKASALQALMEKHQPEGKYLPIKADESQYSKMFEATAVIRIDPVQVSGKVKMGQNRNAEQHQQIRENLHQRGDVLDVETVELMQKYGSK